MDSKRRFVVDNHALLQDFDLSRNNSLRTLETTAQSITVAAYGAAGFLATVLSSVTSPAALDVVVVYRDNDLGGRKHCPLCGPGSICLHHLIFPCDTSHYDPLHFLIFREMHSVRDFHLVLCVDVFDSMMPQALQLMESIVEHHGFYYLPHEPSIICERRTLRTRVTDFAVGCVGSNIPASAL